MVTKRTHKPGRSTKPPEPEATRTHAEIAHNPRVGDEVLHLKDGRRYLARVETVSAEGVVYVLLVDDERWPDQAVSREEWCDRAEEVFGEAGGAGEQHDD